MKKAAHGLLLADTHVGSQFGLWPRGHQHSGGTHQLTSYQERLLTWFESVVHDVPRLDFVIVNGDLIDGENPVTSGRCCITSDPADQAQAAVALLAPLRKKTKSIYLVRGTPYHEGASHEGLEFVGSELKCERWGAGNRYSDLVLERNWRGHVLNVTHHGPTNFVYPAGALNRMAMFAALAEIRKHAPHAEVIVRAHSHQDGMLRDHGQWLISQPSWCYVTPYGIKRMEYYRAYATSAVGAVLLTERDGRISPTDYAFEPPAEEVLPL